MRPCGGSIPAAGPGFGASVQAKMAFVAAEEEEAEEMAFRGLYY